LILEERTTVSALQQFGRERYRQEAYSIKAATPLCDSQDIRFSWLGFGKVWASNCSVRRMATAMGAS